MAGGGYEFGTCNWFGHWERRLHNEEENRASKNPGRCAETCICLSRPPTSMTWMTCKKNLSCLATELYTELV